MRVPQRYPELEQRSRIEFGKLHPNGAGSTAQTGIRRNTAPPFIRRPPLQAAQRRIASSGWYKSQCLAAQKRERSRTEAREQGKIQTRGMRFQADQTKGNCETVNVPSNMPIHAPAPET